MAVFLGQTKSVEFAASNLLIYRLSQDSSKSVETLSFSQAKYASVKYSPSTAHALIRCKTKVACSSSRSDLAYDKRFDIFQADSCMYKQFRNVVTGAIVAFKA